MANGGEDQRDEQTRWADWRFFIDENLNPSIASGLEQHGIQAEHAIDALFEGADDFKDILPYCRETNAILVTNNVRDFNPTILSPEDHAGIVIVHNKNRPPEEIASEIRRMVAAYRRREALRGFESADDWH